MVAISGGGQNAVLVVVFSCCAAPEMC